MSDRRSIWLDRSRLRTVGVAAVLLAVAASAGRAALADAAPGRVRGGALPVAAPDPLDRPPDVPSYPPLVDGPGRPADLELPAEEAGTHRTWFATGTWWAVLPDPVSGVHRIWGLSGPDGPWIDTGTLVDERPYALVDVAWDGEDLVVASTGRRAYRGHALRVHRFGWSASARRWVPAADHPIELTTEGEPLARLAVTTDGTAWLVRPRGKGLEVARTAGRAPRWAGWTPLPVEGAATDVGGYDVLAVGDELVVTWRRLSANAIVVARGREEWRRSEVEMAGVMGVGPVDAASAPDGGPLAVLVSTTAAPGAAGDQAPSLLLAVVPPDEAPDPTPTVAVVARGADGLTQPSLLVDGSAARVLAIVPPTEDEVISWFVRGQGAPTALVEKQAPLAEPLFAPGVGRRLMSGVDGAPMARPLLPRQVVPGGGLVVVASGAGATRWSTWADGVAPAPEAPAPAGADAVTVLVDDTFDSLPVGGPGPTSWAPEDADPPVGVVVDDPSFPSRSLQLVGGPDPVSACRPIPELPAEVVTVEASMRSSGAPGTADTRLLTVRGTGGSVASVRLSRLGLAGWSTSAGRVTGLPVAAGAVLVISVRLELPTRTADITVSSTDGAVLAQGADIPWLTAGDGTVDELCIRPAPGDGTAVVVDAVRVTLR
ncbi:hypothetical protein HC251_07190 [Iamia sp. SCSIO 61187]|uniref:hypothetical protein n=1 Tax=Iamia sp. SCSIO 61187 TaxID=2722752 RepID=UPI001C635C1B|nr:hypothetical protein [Iamia sp. SCSIO 61187]QYG92242.1 hypothetical protein HC251_07190 [Iamia sp. SCSIO 61187]